MASVISFRRSASRAARLLALVGLLALVSLPAVAQTDQSPQRDTTLRWEKLPPIPDREGFAAPFAGVSGGALIVAGGASFPDKRSWENGKKIWYDSVFVLEDTNGAWKTGLKLLRPLAYGLSATARDGVVCVGGSDAQRHYADVFLLKYADGTLTRTTLPSLPRPCANASGALLGETLYLAGGTETPNATRALKTFWSLDMSRPKADWKELEPWPGPERMLAVAGVQDGSFFLFSGVTLHAGADGKPVREYLRDAYRFTPGGGWKRCADLPRSAAAAPSPAIPSGQSHLLVLGGDDTSPLPLQPPVPREALAYHTITDTWTSAGALPFSRVTTPMTPWQGRFVIPGGEAKPGIRSPEVWSAEVTRRKSEFGWANYAALGVYPLIMVGITWLVGRKRTSEEFFRGGQRIPWWAVGLSIYATMLSSLTFMAVPAKAYATDWTFFLSNVPVLLLAPVIIAVYLPFFRQLDVTSAYEYLEKRFNLSTRWFGSLSFIVLQIGRTAIVLYLPALALATVSNFSMVTSILIMGVICIAMTFEGGIEAVVWTDVAQTVILLAGALATLLVIVGGFPGGAVGLAQIAAQDHKGFSPLRWDASLTAATVWVILIGNLFSNLIPYTASQDVVQRYVTTKDERQAARSIWTNALMVLPSSALFFAVGTALYAFYKRHPERLDPALNSDAVFPLFMVNEMPAGLGGLVVAGIFAAAQPTSSLNSIATAWVTDFHVRLRPNLSDAARLASARWATILSGIVGTAIALAMTYLDIKSTWDAFIAMLGLTGGALAGLFALGLFTRRAHGTGAMIGAIASVVTLYLVQRYTTLHIFTYGAIGIVTCFAVGWIASALIPAAHKSLEGLTVFTAQRAQKVSDTPHTEEV